MDGSKPPLRARWKLIFQTTFIFSITAVVSFMMWKSYFLAATAVVSFGWAKPQTNTEGVDTSDANPRLRFEKDGTFKMSIFEDLHFGEGEDNRKFPYPLIHHQSYVHWH